jgi:hypothetical protein
MNRKDIEEKDRLLLERIRATVKHNEQKSYPRESLGKRINPWLPVGFIALIVASLWMFRQQSATTVSSSPLPDAQSTTQADVTPAHDRAGGQLAPAAPQTAPTLQAAATLAPAPDPPATIRQPAKPLQPMTMVPPEPVEAAAPPPSARITEIASCRAVDQRQCVAPASTFSLQETPTPVVWMNVLSDQQPFTLTHAYYLNGRKYCDVPLEIRYPRMRTWSNVTLAHPYQTGHWRVEVIDADGERLSQIEFTVTP